MAGDHEYVMAAKVEKVAYFSNIFTSSPRKHLM
jgi:hypothetical protein